MKIDTFLLKNVKFFEKEYVKKERFKRLLAYCWHCTSMSFFKNLPPPKKKNQLKQCCLVLNGMFMHFKRNQWTHFIVRVPNLGIQLQKTWIFTTERREERGLNYSLYLNCFSIYKCDMMYMYAMQTGNY